METEKIITSASKDKKLSIGDNLYKYIMLRGIGTYEVCGFLDNFILVKSTFCNSKDHPCIIKINKVDGRHDTYKYVEMIQTCGADVHTGMDEYGEEVEVDGSYVWHTSNDGYYYISKRKCAEDHGKKIIADYRDDINKRKYKIKEIEKDIEQRENRIKELELWINKIEIS